MSLKLSSLAHLDPERDIVLSRRRNVRVASDATCSALLSLSTASACERADGLTLVTRAGEQQLPARGVARALARDELRVPLAELRARALHPPPTHPASLRSARADARVDLLRALRAPPDAPAAPPVPRPRTADIEIVPAPDGTLTVPLAQADALALRFTARDEVAVKVGFAGRNAVSGERWVPGRLSKKPQNYFVCREQTWLRGVKQPSCSGVAQIAARALERAPECALDEQPGGRMRSLQLHVEIFPLRRCKVWISRLRKFVSSLEMTPQQLGLEAGDVVCFFRTHDPRFRELTLKEYGLRNKDEVIVRYSEKMTIFVKCLNRRRLELLAGTRTTVHNLKCQLEDIEGIPVEEQRLVFSGQELEDSAYLLDYGAYDFCEMHMVLRAGKNHAGAWSNTMGVSGRIMEDVFKGDGDLDRFCEAPMESVTLDVVNSLEFARVMGREMSPSPLTEAVFSMYGVPWMCLYDEDARFRPLVTEHLAAGSNTNFEAEPMECLSCLQRKPCEEMLPCRHVVCAGCLHDRVSSDRTSVVSDGFDVGPQLLACPACRGSGFLKRAPLKANEQQWYSEPTLSSISSSLASANLSSSSSEAACSRIQSNWTIAKSRRKQSDV